MESLGVEIRTIREEKGLSQEGLAKLMGHARPSTIQSWESGRRTPKIASLRRLAKALEQPESRLIGALTSAVTAQIKDPTSSGGPPNDRALSKAEAERDRYLRALDKAEHDLTQIITEIALARKTSATGKGGTRARALGRAHR